MGLGKALLGGLGVVGAIVAAPVVLPAAGIAALGAASTAAGAAATVVGAGAAATGIGGAVVGAATTAAGAVASGAAAAAGTAGVGALAAGAAASGISTTTAISLGAAAAGASYLSDKKREEARDQGRIEGYISASGEYEKKFRNQEEKTPEQTKAFEADKKNYEKLLDECERQLQA